jgi:hypothetical protein
MSPPLNSHPKTSPLGITGCLFLHAVIGVLAYRSMPAARHHTAMPDVASQLTLLRFYARKEHVQAAPPIPLKAQKQPRPPHAPDSNRQDTQPHRSVPNIAAPPQTPTPDWSAAPAQEQASATPTHSLDMAALKKAARDEAAHMPQGERTPTLSHPATPFHKAERPKCDDQYVPKVGPISFTGLMKLPFLAKDAVAGTGCKF